MPVDPGFRCGIGQDVERAAGYIGFGHTRPDAQRFDIPALLVRPRVQLLADPLQHVFGAGLVKVFEYYIPVAAPFIDKAVFVILDLSRHK